MGFILCGPWMSLQNCMTIPWKSIKKNYNKKTNQCHNPTGCARWRGSAKSGHFIMHALCMVKNLQGLLIFLTATILSHHETHCDTYLWTATVSSQKKKQLLISRRSHGHMKRERKKQLISTSATLSITIFPLQERGIMSEAFFFEKDAHNKAAITLTSCEIQKWRMHSGASVKLNLVQPGSCCAP